jgi:RNA polymerase sigma-70 factor (ECF subfamily)
MTREDHRDRAILTTLIENRRRFLSFLTRRVANPADAEEILQSAFVKGIEAVDSVRDQESVVAWFYRTLRNAVIDFYRHRDAARRALEQVASSFGDPWQPDPEAHRSICQCVTGLLPAIKEDYADLLYRVDIRGESIAQIARRTGMTPNNTRVKLHRARRSLRKQVHLACGACAEHGCLDCDCRRSD